MVSVKLCSDDPCCHGNENLLIYLKCIDFNYKLEIFLKNCRLSNLVLYTPVLLLPTLKTLCFVQELGTYLLYKQSYSKFSVKFQ